VTASTRPSEAKRMCLWTLNLFTHSLALPKNAPRLRFQCSLGSNAFTRT
jgi:hypothetical protein